MPKVQKGFREIDVRAGVNACVTALVYMLLYKLIPGVDDYINICVMAIAAVFITEADWKKTWSAGLTRCIVIGIGVIFGFAVVFLDGLFHSDVAVCLLLGVGTVCMLVVEKLTGKMYVQCKLGSVSMVLTVFTFRGEFYAQMGKSCYGYGVMFFLSTVLTAAICLAVMCVWDALRGRFGKGKTEP